MKRSAEGAEAIAVWRKKRKKGLKETIDGTPIYDVRGKLNYDTEFVFKSIVKIPASDLYFEADMLNLQLRRKNLTYPNVCINFSIGGKFITDTFYYANKKMLKTAHGDGDAGIYISKEEYSENNRELNNPTCDFFNLFFLKEESTPLFNLGCYWHNPGAGEEHFPLIPVQDLVNSEIIVDIHYYSKKQFIKDLKKYFLISQILSCDVAGYIMINYLIPKLSDEGSHGIRRKIDSTNFDLEGNEYIARSKWQGQPRGFGEMLGKFMKTFILKMTDLDAK
ncbi:MAG TPA: hypothetical protein VFP45_03355 [Candidatus Nitrosotalea sp.]|nr:hypothetical protein [Candidatus Nitrosotalea sp.]